MGARRLWLAVLFCGLAGVAAAQPSSQGGAAIAGTLTSADLGRPIRRASVKLVSREPARTRLTTTDANGRFRFAGLPAGEYTLSFTKPGFLESVFGARRPGPGVAGTVIHLRAEEQLDTLAMRLPRGGVISGIVTDEFGDPALGVPVRAMRLAYAHGERIAQSSAMAVTDDLGAYRLPGLLPGDYIVSAVPRDSVAAQAAMEESLRARQTEIAAAGRPVPAAVADREATKSARGYVPVYFGATVSPSAATRVSVAVGQHVAAVDIQLIEIATATLTGRIVGPDGSPVAARLQLVDPAMPVANLGVWFRSATPGGRFAFAGLAPGPYVLNAQGSARAAGGLLTASATIPVEGDSEVEVTLRAGVTVSGALDPASARPPVNVQKLRVQLDPIAAPSDWEATRLEDAPEPDGTFTIRGVPAGRYRIAVAGLPAGWSLASAVFGGRDAADHNLVVDRGGEMSAGLLKLTAATGTIAGTVSGMAGAPAGDRTLVVFPSDRSLRVPLSRRIHTIQPSADGRFMVRGLAAGEYLIAAVDGVEPGQQFDPEFLARLDADAVVVHVKAGAQADVDVRVR